MPRTKPPFRADHVGSLLRPAALKEARPRRERGEISPEELKAVEDREIEKVIRKQEEVGLRSVTDGEFRRAFWNYDFLGEIDGVEAYLGERKIKFQGPQPKPMMLRVVGKLGGYRPHPMIDHFKFVAAHAKATPKMTIPSPSSLHFRYGRDAVPTEIYPEMDDFYRDLGEGYRKAVRAFSDAGCRYLQLDEVNFTYLCDPKLRAFVANRGEDPETLPHVYARMINAALSDVAPDVTKAMHLCRGNFQSTFVASGGYEPVAEILFNEINIDAYFMEYDSDRAGGFAPLRFVPKGKMVVLGLVTSKSGTLESKDELKRRIDQAARFIDLDQLCLSPQCGFASTEEGNILAEDEQWAKLRRIVEVADEVWG
ncbi:MAG TPA: 5-methyltetrahydropteroyltriglutamate--homocysteine S-methyltransferase [Xanthobacteraceae bacterium]|nr:5-methyltetrahydropteroyltriglutamate--homocysteine S-methyltransferase [Xanthobacteraceae bacterium]